MIFLTVVLLILCGIGILGNVFNNNEYMERTPTNRMISVIIGTIEFIVLINALSLFRGK